MPQLTRIVELLTHAIHVLEPLAIRLVLLAVFIAELIRFALSATGLEAR